MIYFIRIFIFGGPMKAKYKRVLLKISGEALAGEKHSGINDELLMSVAKDIKALKEMGVEIALVVGGGNFWRGRTSDGMDRASADYMGMLATVINALALQDACRRSGIDAVVQTALTIEHIAEPYNKDRARKLLSDGTVVIFGGGTGSPFFSTDTTSALRAAEMECDVILLAKNIDAVYDRDPRLDPNAVRFSRISHTEVLERDLKVMDATAASLCRDYGIKIHVFGLAEKDGILRACAGEEIGTIIE